MGPSSTQAQVPLAGRPPSPGFCVVAGWLALGAPSTATMLGGAACLALFTREEHHLCSVRPFLNLVTDTVGVLPCSVL